MPKFTSQNNNKTKPAGSGNVKGSKHLKTIIRENISLQNLTENNDKFYKIINNYTRIEIEKMLADLEFDGEPMNAMLEFSLKQFLKLGFGKKSDWRYLQAIKEVIIGKPKQKVDNNQETRNVILNVETVHTTRGELPREDIEI